MAKDNLTQQESTILRAILSNPEAVAEWLDEIQYSACAGLIRFPELADHATAHIFDSPNPLYIAVFKATRAGGKGLEGVYTAISRRQGNTTSAMPLAALACHPVSRGEAMREIKRLKKFVAWQYRQEKARRKAA